MPNLRFVITKFELKKGERERKLAEIDGLFNSLPPEIRDDAVMVIDRKPVRHGKDAEPFWLEIRASDETPLKTVVAIANHFKVATDREVYNPQTGTFKFFLRGKRVTQKSLAPA